LALFLLVVFATGGSSRMDVQSLVILQPLSFIFCALAALTLRVEHFAKRGWLIWCASITFAFAMFHLIALPEDFWHSAGGARDAVEIQKLVGITDNWLALTLSPTNGWHALATLFTPLAVMLLGIQLNRDDLFRLLPLIITLAALSGLIGLLQVISDPQGALYFYRVTNNGSAVGLFANRNHSATLLAGLLPMLAVYAATVRGKHDAVQVRKWTAAVIAMMLIPLILVSGSRSGLLGAIIGLGAAALLYRNPGDKHGTRRGLPMKTRALLALWGVSVIGLAILTYFLSRAEAFERLFADGSGENSRTDFWAVSLDLFWKYFPWGSGSGSFATAAQLSEPTSLLGRTYLNRAHNDWVETAVTFGLPGVVALLVIFFIFGARCYVLWCRTDRGRRGVVFGRLASVLVALIAIASVSDYPSRTPTIMGVLAICALWLSEAGRDMPSITANQEIAR
jgi:O-antigen ligase